MSIVFAGLMPHPPLLLPTIGGENSELLTKTAAAFDELEKEFYVKAPETIIIVSPHAPAGTNTFLLPHHPKLTATFESFGDPSTKLEFEHDLILGAAIKEAGQITHNIAFSPENKLDYGSAVPLYFLTRHLKIPVVVIGYSDLDRQSYINLGRLLKKIALSSRERIAFIASADLSHRLDKNSPTDYNASGELFDQEIINFVTKNQLKDLVTMDEKLIVNAGECGYRSLLILSGLLEGSLYETKILSYEKPFGVGYLTANFSLK